MDLPSKLKNKKAIINVQNRDNQCLRWAICATLFPPPQGLKVTRTSSYPTGDGLNFGGIDFPTPVSQIDKLERQNPSLAINVFGWEKGKVFVHRLSEKGSEIPRINSMITKQGENTHYSYVKRLTALFFMIKLDTMKANISANAAYTDTRRELFLKSTILSAKGC